LKDLEPSAPPADESESSTQQPGSAAASAPKVEVKEAKNDPKTDQTKKSSVRNGRGALPVIPARSDRGVFAVQKSGNSSKQAMAGLAAIPRILHSVHEAFSRNGNGLEEMCSFLKMPPGTRECCWT
jgi:hypothetical protein